MKLLALTFGDETCASTQYRILQYRPLMEATGISLVHTPAKSFNDWESLPQYDTVILQKTLLSRRKIRRIAKGARRLLYDSDDRIWLRPGKPYGWLTAFRIKMRLNLIARVAHQCIAANGIIAEDLNQHGAKTTVIPMALNGSVWRPSAPKKDTVTIGWTGSPSSLRYLEEIRPALVAAQQTHPQVHWVIHCGKNPNWTDFVYEHIPYVSGTEPEIVRKFHIGLLPLPVGTFAEGKSPIKALQYFASGVALIHSPVGATIELTNNNTLGLAAPSTLKWGEKVNTLVTDQKLRENMAASARIFFESNHERKSVFKHLVHQLIGER